ncbi:GH25 family lysozyme [Microvirga sp. VF16]|uniref:glycoside hydrolase family 25 protein n=1 Tax=Microvirga sp. VF16 TaxID=2807101 RepID=UPI00193CBB5D|nr:GH25 family lysozyme [Microvirga sp. VF16]QRM34726.1 glycoside hydrolase family 25 protein [Microvirga sp. VF16]
MLLPVRSAIEVRPLSRPGRLVGGAKQLTLVLIVSILVASCAQRPSYYPAKSDAKPHPGVARAQSHPIQGIDVSKWQGKIDWSSVRAAGTKFAFIKATEGGDHVDERFMENWEKARAAGVPRGAYHFVYWCRSATEQVEWFKKNVPADPDALPPVLDVEWNGSSRTCPTKVPREEALSMIRLMLREMEAYTGKRPIIYTDITFHKEVLEGELPDYPHWLRSVAAGPEERYAGRPWILWQYTATGRVPGISGNVDRNAFYGSSADWAQFLSTGCDPRRQRTGQGTATCNTGSRVASAGGT